VLSRRFGLSLGVDLVPAKKCTFDCLYCQIGRTTDLSLERQTWADPAPIIAAVKAAVDPSAPPDVITLAGSGEPTLYAALADLIDGIRAITFPDATLSATPPPGATLPPTQIPKTDNERAIPVVVLTNGSLLYDPAVAAAVDHAQILAPSLDAGDAETFQKINRPHPALDFETFFVGLKQAIARFAGKVRLEVMLVKNVNDSQESLAHLAERIAQLDVDTIDINTPVRPVAGGHNLISTPETLQRALDLFGDKAQLIPSLDKIAQRTGGGAANLEKMVDRVSAMLERRPCTAAEIGGALSLSAVEVSKVLSVLQGRHLLEQRSTEKDPYFFVSKSDH
jgi:wyosine [tRNA(Phe)-imidazoG37] synthetase (radical SAM superfamily)